MRRTRNRAFTLIEILVVIAVLAILVLVSYPSYQGQTLKIRRSDAKKSLLAVAHQLERCYTAYHRYNHHDCASRLDCYKTAGQSLVPDGLTIAAPSCAGYYQITSINPATGGGETLAGDGESYTLFAIPLGSQAQDSRCALFQYTSSGGRTATTAAGGDATADCW
ncbi:type IV pilin protein [Candidatus Thiodictyon syntrophicum]|jgi:type IV pilus assembly protein PilE|nr:type IV pilin protein [Candidatus Thiodictyon syntrophicum]